MSDMIGTTNFDWDELKLENIVNLEDETFVNNVLLEESPKVEIIKKPEYKSNTKMEMINIKSEINYSEKSSINKLEIINIQKPEMKLEILKIPLSDFNIFEKKEIPIPKTQNENSEIPIPKTQNKKSETLIPKIPIKKLTKEISKTQTKSLSMKKPKRKLIDQPKIKRKFRKVIFLNDGIEIYKTKVMKKDLNFEST
jgi:hypothetical protein